MLVNKNIFYYLLSVILLTVDSLISIALTLSEVKLLVFPDVKLICGNTSGTAILNVSLTSL